MLWDVYSVLWYVYSGLWDVHSVLWEGYAVLWDVHSVLREGYAVFPAVGRALRLVHSVLRDARSFSSDGAADAGRGAVAGLDAVAVGSVDAVAGGCLSPGYLATAGS